MFESEKDDKLIRYSLTKNISSLTKFLKKALYFYIVISGIFIISYLMELYLLFKREEDESVIALNDLRQFIIFSIHTIVFIVIAIAFLKWTYRANKNCQGFTKQVLKEKKHLQILGEKIMRFSPGWSIGYYFIPILNLYKPYQAMKEIYLFSSDAEAMKIP